MTQSFPGNVYLSVIYSYIHFVFPVEEISAMVWNFLIQIPADIKHAILNKKYF